MHANGGTTNGGVACVCANSHIFVRFCAFLPCVSVLFSCKNGVQKSTEIGSKMRKKRFYAIPPLSATDQNKFEWCKVRFTMSMSWTFLRRCRFSTIFQSSLLLANPFKPKLPEDAMPTHNLRADFSTSFLEGFLAFSCGSPAFFEEILKRRCGKINPRLFFGLRLQGF